MANIGEDSLPAHTSNPTLNPTYIYSHIAVYSIKFSIFSKTEPSPTKFIFYLFIFYRTLYILSSYIHNITPIDRWSIDGIDKIRNHLVAKPILTSQPWNLVLVISHGLSPRICVCSVTQIVVLSQIRLTPLLG